MSDYDYSPSARAAELRVRAEAERLGLKLLRTRRPGGAPDEEVFQLIGYNGDAIRDAHRTWFEDLAEVAQELAMYARY
jgi:hypothetical protein